MFQEVDRIKSCLTMKILFIDGTGRLNKDVAALAVERGMDVTLLTRGSSNRSMFIPEACQQIHGNIRNEEERRKLLERSHYDAVIDFLSFTVHQLDRTLRIVADHCKQFIFISTATVFITAGNEPISEERTTVGNREWVYSWNKYLCEKFLENYCRDHRSLTYSIVRPHVTYGNTWIPYSLAPSDTLKEWPFARRMKLGLPIPLFDG